jgi:hypothetical protein
MRKFVLVFILLLSLACATIIPTPNDFPPPPMTVIVEFPNVTAVPTFELLPHPITSEKMLDAQTFFLILKTRVLSGDNVGISETVKYPLAVGANVISTADEFVANYNEIFTGDIMTALSDTSEEDLTFSPDGVHVGNAAIWFNLFCVDAACSDTQFLITQINP